MLYWTISWLRGNKMVNYEEIIEKLATEWLENNDPTELSIELIQDTLQEKKKFIQNTSDMSDEQFYEEIDNDVFEKIQEITITQEVSPNISKVANEKQKKIKSKGKQKKIKSRPKVKQGEKLWEFTCYSGLWRKFIGRMKTITDEVKITVNSEGISTRSVDPAHVCMVDMAIPRKDFYKGKDCINKNIGYKVKEEFDMGIDVDKLENTMKLIDHYSPFTGYVQDNNLYIDTEKIHKKITLVDTFGMPDAKIPEIEFDVHADVKASDLALLVKACGASDYIRLESDGKEIWGTIFEDEDETKIKLGKDVKGKGKSLYSTDYFAGILHGLTAHKTITLDFGTDNPIRIRGEVYDSGTFEYLLAPRIESE